MIVQSDKQSNDHFKRIKLIILTVFPFNSLKMISLKKNYIKYTSEIQLHTGSTYVVLVK